MATSAPSVPAGRVKHFTAARLGPGYSWNCTCEGWNTMARLCALILALVAIVVGSSFLITRLAQVAGQAGYSLEVPAALERAEGPHEEASETVGFARP